MSAERNREILKKRLEDDQFTRSEKQVVSGVSRRMVLKGVAGLGIATTLGGGLWTLFNRGGTETKANSVQPEPTKKDTTPVHTVSSTNVDTTETTESKPEETVSTDVGEADGDDREAEKKVYTFNDGEYLKELLKNKKLVAWIYETPERKAEVKAMLEREAKKRVQGIKDMKAGHLASSEVGSVAGRLEAMYRAYKKLEKLEEAKAKGMDVSDANWDNIAKETVITEEDAEEMGLLSGDLNRDENGDLRERGWISTSNFFLVEQKGEMFVFEYDFVFDEEMDPPLKATCAVCFPVYHPQIKEILPHLQDDPRVKAATSGDRTTKP